MAKTPHHLRMLGVPEDCGPDRAVPRAIMAYRKDNKKEVLSLYFSMIMAGALPEYDASPLHVRNVTHSDLAAMNGVRRETVTRRMGRVSTGRNRWDEAMRKQRSQQEKQRAAAAGKKIHNRALRSLEPVAPLLQITPRFNGPNLYSGPAGAHGGRTMPHRAAALLAQKYGEDVFDPSARVNGFKKIDAFIWHPRLPDPRECECKLGQERLSFQEVCPTCAGRGVVFEGALADYGRVLATYYQLMGIEDEIPELRDGRGNLLRKRKPAGMLQIPQWKIAQDLGMDEDTVSKYNAKLVDLLIIKIVPGDKVRNDAGSIIASDPDKIMWMPSRLLDHEICVAERERFLRAKQKLQDQAAASRADQVHVELLKAWNGREHSLKAFWNELRRQYAAQGVPRDVREALLPSFRE